MSTPQGSLDLWRSLTPYIRIWIPTFFQHPSGLFLRVYAMLSASFQWVIMWAAVRQGMVAPPTSSPGDYTANAEAAFTTLQLWYDHDTGIYNTTGWWNSANC